MPTPHAIADELERYAFKPMDFSEPEPAAPSVSHAGGTSIPVPDHARVGQTMTMNGRQYVLREETPGKPRWHLMEGSTDKTMAAPGTHAQQTAIQPQGQSGKPAPSVKEAWKREGQQQSTHEERHRHVASQLGSVPQELRGVIAAMHNRPDYQRGGETATSSLPAKQAGGLRNWLQQNVGRQVQGGRVVNLGNGALGFSGQAGAIVVWPADASGRHKVGYTNNTGPVAEGMRGGRQQIPMGVVPPPQIVPPPQEPITAEAADEPPAKPFEPKGIGQAPQTAAGLERAPQKGPQPATSHPAQAFSPKGLGQQPQQAAALERIDQPGKPQPVSPPVQISDTPRASDTPTEDQPPADIPTHARDLHHARSMFEEGMRAFADAAARGLSQRGHGRWRAYTAALRSIWRNAEDNARTPLFRQQKPASQGRRGKQQEWTPPGSAHNADFGDTLEKDAAAKDPKKSADLQAMREHGFLDEAGYRKSLEAIMRPAAAAPPADDPSAPQDDIRRQAEEAAAAWQSQNQPASQPEEQPPAPEKPAPPSGQDPWSIPPPPKSDKPPAATTNRRFNPAKLRSYAKGFAGHIDFAHTDAGQKAIEEAIAKGHIQNPRQLRGVLKTAKRLYEKGNMRNKETGEQIDSAPHVQEAIRRLRNRADAEAWQHRVADYAADFDLTPQEFEDHAKGMYGDFKDYHENREGVKDALRKMVGPGFSARKLEDQGQDSDALSPYDKQLQEFASEYPHIFQGDDHMETAWQLLKEGQQRVPALRSEEFLKHVAEQMGHAADKQYQEPAADEGATPFTLRGQPDRYYFHPATTRAARETAQPTEAQAKAGNYKKGRVRLHGLDIVIENAKGSRRKPEWPPLAAHYGYIARTKDRDGDQVDCYIGPHPSLETVFVVDQVRADGDFDEHKAIFGVGTEEQARNLYLENYPKGWRCGKITQMTVRQFKNWLESGNQFVPVAGQVSRYTVSYEQMVDLCRAMPEVAAM